MRKIINKKKWNTYFSNHFAWSHTILLNVSSHQLHVYYIIPWTSSVDRTPARIISLIKRPLAFWRHFPSFHYLSRLPAVTETKKREGQNVSLTDSRGRTRVETFQLKSKTRCIDSAECFGRTDLWQMCLLVNVTGVSVLRGKPRSLSIVSPRRPWRVLADPSPSPATARHQHFLWAVFILSSKPVSCLSAYVPVVYFSSLRFHLRLWEGECARTCVDCRTIK